MIGRITGRLLEKFPPWLLIDVNGLGYELQAPMNTFYNLGNIGDEVTLHTHMIVREDAQLLYGFFEKQELELFKEFIKINGIGAKAALALLSGLSILELKKAIMTEEVGMLKKIPGIGPKTAQRIIVEMQDKTKKWQPIPLTTEPSPLTEDLDSAVGQAIQALVALGYKIKDASKAVHALKDQSLGCEDIIKQALQGLAKA